MNITCESIMDDLSKKDVTVMSEKRFQFVYYYKNINYMKLLSQECY